MADRDIFLATARSLIGTPFHHQGRSIYGVDCVGLIILAAQAAGVDTSKDITNYSRIPNGVLLGVLDDAMVAVDGAWAVADILAFRIRREPRHVGIWTGSTVIHTNSSVGRVVEHDLSDAMRRCVVKTYRLREFS